VPAGPHENTPARALRHRPRATDAGDATQVINSTTASPTPLEVDSATSSSALYTGNVALLTPGVYTLFMLGDAATPSAVLRLDR
jgi:hypothetical protein